MASIAENKAAWITAPQANPLEVGPGPDQSEPAGDELVVKVACVALNPSEWKFQDMAYLPVKYPHVLGSDAAGEVVKIGSRITRFHLGDRVIGYGLGLLNGAKEGTFQNYVTLKEVAVSRIPDHLPFANAAVLPLSISTAAAGLYDVLKLDLPTLDPKPKGKTVLIWGGSSSCGSSAIQLAVASGYTVTTTASPHNHTYVKELGATHVFDHSSANVVERIFETVGNNLVAVFDLIGADQSVKACVEILSRVGGGVVASTWFPPENLPTNTTIEMVWSTSPVLKCINTGRAVWGDYIPKALTQGKFVAKPDPIIIKGGLQKIQEAMDLQKKGVSARKIVVEVVEM